MEIEKQKTVKPPKFLNDRAKRFGKGVYVTCYGSERASIYKFHLVNRPSQSLRHMKNKLR